MEDFGPKNLAKIVILLGRVEDFSPKNLAKWGKLLGL